MPSSTCSRIDLAGQSVLVTGAEGFIGSHLVELLVSKGAGVTALSLYNSFNDWGWLETVPCLKQVRVVTGDVRDAGLCRQLVEGIDVVFHLAALIPVPYSHRAPASFIDTNVVGTLNMCQEAAQAKVKRFIHVSTSEVYGTAQCVPVNEQHRLMAQSPYSASKIGADAIATSYYHSFALPVVVARPFNTYGPRQSARAVIPTIITQIAAGLDRVYLGETSATRDFTFVTDTCQGLVAIAEMEGGLGEVFHIGTNSEISIADTFLLIAELMGSNACICPDEARKRPASSEVLRLRCDNRKLAAATGFTPETPFREGLSRTIAWFRNSDNLRRYKTGLYNV